MSEIVKRVTSRIKTMLRSWRKYQKVICIGVTGVILLGAGGVAAYRTQRPLTLTLASRQSVPVAGPLKIDLSQDVAAGFETVIEPKLAGTWKQERTVLGVSAVSFEPKNRFEAGQKYTLRLRNLKRAVTGVGIPDMTQTFTAKTPASLKLVTPAAGTKDIPAKARFKVELATANQGVRDLRAVLEPAAPLKLVSTDDKVFIWEPETPLKQGVSYTFGLDDMRMSAPEKRRMVTVPFTTVTQPGIVSARTGGGVSLGQAIDVVFDQPMDPNTGAFKFDVSGKGSWVDDKTYRFTPEGIKPGTTYGYKIAAGLASKAGGVLEAERPYQFTTTGAIGASLSPGGGGAAINTSIRVVFDQAVDHASAEARFSISPAAAGKFSWSGNAMTYAPANLAYQTTYTYSVAAGVVPKWGLPNARALSGSFATTYQVIKLGVPAYKGQYWMACELSSLRMLLSYRGVKVDDWAILMKLNYNPRPRDKATNTWDNPNLMYVGDVNGRPNTTGYGVHAGPIADAAKTFGHNATAQFNVTANFIAQNIHSGNPVMVYGHSDAAQKDAWNTSSGVVQTLRAQHARVVYGVAGRPEAPIGFYLNEPMNGSTFYWTAAQLMQNMNAVPPSSNQAVVVY